MRFHDSGVTKRTILSGLRDLAQAPAAETRAAAAAIFAPDAGYLCAHPVNQLHGLDAIDAVLWQPSNLNTKINL